MDGLRGYYRENWDEIYDRSRTSASIISTKRRVQVLTRLLYFWSARECDESFGITSGLPSPPTPTAIECPSNRLHIDNESKNHTRNTN